MGQINTYQDLVDAIDAHGIEETVKAYRKPPLHTRILRELYDLYLDQPKYVEFLAHYPLIPSDLAERIAEEADEAQVEIACGLASNPRSSQQTLNRLTTHPDTSVRLALAANPNLTPKECQALVVDDNPYIRATLAGNPALPVQQQFILSADENPGVRIALSTRKTLDLDIAVHLSHDNDPMVRAAIINMWSQDPELLHLWAERDDAQQQQLLFRRNKPLEPALLDTLRLSPHSDTRQQALERAGLSGPHMLWLAESDDTEDRIFLAEQSDLPAGIQRILAQDSSPKVRRRLAANAGIDAGIALHIAASDDLPACRALAKNPAIQDECIARLCTHADDNIALLVAYRDDLNDDHRDLLFNHRLSPGAAEHLAYQGIGYKRLCTDTAETLARAEAPSLRAFAAHSANLADETFKRLSQDPADQVRHAVANNPATPEQYLQALTTDSNRDILFAAEDNLIRRLRTQEKASEAIDESTPYDDEPEQGRDLLKKIITFFKD